MEKGYKHLTAQDRVFLSMMLQKNYPKAKIAETLGVHRSTIYREIKRNGCKPKRSVTGIIFYLPSGAQKKYQARRRRQWKLHSDKNLQTYVHEKLLKGWSPWQIEGRLKRDNLGVCLISHETIYRYIYSDYIIRNRFHKKLRRQHYCRVKSHSRKARIPAEYQLKNRPLHINEREEFGHWEGDLMLFKRGTQSNLLTLRERKSRVLVAVKNPSKRAKGTAINIITALKSYKSYVYTITFDQGSEFMDYECIGDCLDASIYFCEPASPEQKGCIENGNGVIRTELSRDCQFDKIRQEEITALINEINHRPMKCLDYQTPAEVFEKHTGEIIYL